MAETFNPIISHLYSGQGGVSREITKYNNTTISEINFKESGVTTKYDFGGLFNEKMFTGNRVWNQLVSTRSQSFTAGTNTIKVLSNTTVPMGHKVLVIWKQDTTLTSITRNTPYFEFSDGTSVYLSTAENRNLDKGIYSWLYTPAKNISSLKYWGHTPNVDLTITDIQFFDLTDIYGAGNEPTTVAEFVHDYGDEYYPYNAGTNFSLATKLFNTIKQPLDSIKFYGNTMRWCQLVQNGNFVDESGWLFNASNHSVANNVLSLIATAQYGNAVKTNVSFISGHKYLLLFLHKGTTGSFSVYTNTSVYFDTGINNVSDSSFTLRGGIITYDKATTSTRVNFQDNRASDWTEQQFKNVQLFDLTYIFGEGNEPTTVSDFTRRLKKLYYPFTNGEILSIEKASEYLYGINIWDEEWEVGGIDPSSGATFVDATHIRSKNFIRIIPNMAYYNKISTSDNGIAYFYDSDFNFIGVTNPFYSNHTFTTPTNAQYMKFMCASSYGTTYNNDICVNLSDSSINGTYEASKGEQKMQLDSFNVWDEETEAGTLDENGEPTATSANVIRSKNFCECLGNTDYFLTRNNHDSRLYWYDANKNFISRNAWGTNDQIYTAPTNARYFKIIIAEATYNNDICINLSDPSRNGIYVPYRRYVELNGINDVIDVVTVEKNVTLPFGLVDLGDLTWYYLESSGHEAMYSTGIQSSAKHPISDSTVANIVCGMFSTVTRNQQYNHSSDFIIAMSDDGTLFVYSTTMGTTGASFKDSVKGKYLYYELADHPLNDTPILAGSYVRKIEKYTFTGEETWLDYGSGKKTSAILTGSAASKEYDAAVVPNLITDAGLSPICRNDIYNGVSGILVSGTVIYASDTTNLTGKTIYYELATPVETTLTAQQCAEILNGAFTKSKYSTLLTDNDNGQIDQTVDVGMWEQK